MPEFDAANWIIVAWLTVVGGVIGSFLNVVVYRLPLGLSLIDPPSHCPMCKHRIRWHDNVPVLGWAMRSAGAATAAAGFPSAIRWSRR